MKDINDIYFPGKEPDEVVQLALRRHKVAIGKKLSVFIILMLVPVILFVTIVSLTDWLDDAGSFLYMFFILVSSVLYLLALLSMYHAWVDYYLDIWIITNERVIATEQKGLFHRVTSELRLNRIQDVSSEVRGLFPTLFGYGTVHVQTASEQEKFIFREVPNPDLVARQILQLHERYVGLDQTPELGAATHQSSTAEEAK